MTPATGERCLDAPYWARLGWLMVGAQVAACGLLILMRGWIGAPVLAMFAIVSATAVYCSPPAPSLLSFLFAVAAVLNAAGWIWNLYDRYWWYDDLLHFLMPFALVGAFSSAAFRLQWAERPKSRNQFVALTAAAGLFIGLAWEASEAIFIDFPLSDTLFDLAFDTTGAASSGWLIWTLSGNQGARS